MPSEDGLANIYNMVSHCFLENLRVEENLYQHNKSTRATTTLKVCVRCQPCMLTAKSLQTLFNPFKCLKPNRKAPLFD